MANVKARDRKHSHPDDGTQELDALMYFIKKKYDNAPDNLANIGCFFLKHMDVVFGDTPHVRTSKNLESNIYEIVAPRVSKGKEEDRRIDLLGKFSGPFIAAQGEGIRQVREMLLPMLDDEGYKVLIDEYKVHWKKVAK